MDIAMCPEGLFLRNQKLISPEPGTAIGALWSGQRQGSSQTAAAESQLYQIFPAQGHAGPYTYPYGSDNKKAYLRELLLGLNEFAYKIAHHT